MSRTPLLVPNILLVIVAFSFCLPAQAERIHTGILTYPLRHNISLEEGTLECWVKFRFEPSEVLPKQEFQGLLGFLSLSGESGGIGASYFAGSIFRPEAGWHLRFTPQSKMLPLGKRTVWKKDEWHHWAFTWKGRDTWFYLDGKEVSHRSHPTSFTDVVGSLGGKPVLPHWPFFFGERWNVGAKFVMDDMRLSLVARKPEELGFHVGELKPDPYTAILDPFVHIVETDGKQFTSPSIILNGQGGLPTSLCKTVKGRFGNGLSLIKLPDDEPPVIVGRIAKPAFPERISNPRYDRLHPRLGIPIVTRPPTIDGIVGAREWFASAAIGYLLDDETGLAGHQNSTVRLAYDEKALYIAFRFERPSHNLRPSNDDLCEVRLHSKDHPKPFALRANISRIVHAETADRSSPSSVYRARLTDFGWEGELALPWSAIADTNFPRAGQILRANFARIERTPQSKTWRWSYLGRYPPALHHDGSLRLLGKPVAVSIRAGWLKLTRERGTAVTVSNFTKDPLPVAFGAEFLAADNIQELPFLPALHDEITDDLGQPRSVPMKDVVKKLLVPFPKAKTTSERASIPPSTSKLFLLTQADKPGDSLVRVRLDGVDGSLAEALVPARIPDHLGLRVKTFLLTGALEYEVDLRRMRDKLTEAAALQVSVTGPQGPVGRHRHENIKTKEVVRGAFRYQVEPGSIYSVKAKVLDGAKEIAVRGLQTTTASEESFPDWWTMNEGFEPLIPPPWSEVKTNGSKIEILGRTYELTAQALPVRITTRGHSILAGPIRLETSGLWKTGELKQKDSRPDFASYVGTLDRDDLHVQIENRIEFDGFMAITVRIEGFSSLGRLDLVIPFKAEHAKLLQNYYTAPGPAKRVARFTGEIPAGGYKSPPFITTWIGTDHYGLEFSCESSKGWAMAEPQEAMEVTRKGDQVLLTVHFISKPVTVEHRQTRTIRFGLVATPTKTVLPYLKRARFYDDVYVALLPIDWSGFPAWHPPMKDKARIEEKRKWVESVHKRGQKLLVNGGWAISMQDTDNEPWVHEMFKEPKQNVSYSSARQFAYCYRTPYAQFLANSFPHNARLLGFDGIRFDTVTPGYTCKSLAHGCGWYDDDGNLWPTYNLFAQREIWKRIYRAFHGGVIKEGIVYTPNAAGPLMAVHSFSDHHEIGEGFYQKAPNLKKGYPPGMVRTTMTGDAYGFVTCSNIKMGPLFWNERIAALLVNGAEPRFHDYRHWRAGYAAHANPAASIWDAWDWVDRYSAKWLGWWENEECLQIDAGKKMVLGSLWLQGNRSLLVITNYEEDPIRAQPVKLNLSKLGMEAPAYGEDAITGQPIPISRTGSLKLDLFGQRYRLLKISDKLPAYRKPALSKNLLRDVPAGLQQSWKSDPVGLAPDSTYVLTAEVRIDRPMGAGSKNPNFMGRFSPQIRHYVTIGLDAPGVTGMNNSNRRAGPEPYDQTDTYRRSYLPQWWKPTGGWSTMFVPVRTGSTTKTGRFSVGITDRGEAQVRNLSLKKVIN